METLLDFKNEDLGKEHATVVDRVFFLGNLFTRSFRVFISSRDVDGCPRIIAKVCNIDGSTKRRWFYVTSAELAYLRDRWKIYDYVEMDNAWWVELR